MLSVEIILMNQHAKRYKLAVIAIIGLVVIFHVLLVLRDYPVAVFRAGEIPVKGDISRYFATANGAASISGIFGYDPYFMAGYPVGLWNSMGKKGFEILGMLFPFVGLPRLFYVTIVGLCIVSPLLVWLVLRARCGSRRSITVLFAVTLLTWHLAGQISYFWKFGNIFFPAASCMLVPLLVCLDRVLTGRGTVISACGAAVCAAAIFYFHTVVLLAAVAPGAALFFAHRRRFRVLPRAWISLAVFTALLLVLIVWWLVPLLAHREYCLPQPKPWFAGGPKHMAMDVFSDRAYGHPFDRNAILQTLVIAGMAGTWLARRQSMLILALGVGGMGALVVAYGFPYLGRLSAVQPYRFLIPAMILFAGPASLALDRGWTSFQSLTEAAKGLVVLILLVLTPRFSAYLIDLKWPPLPCGTNATQREVLETVRGLPIKGRLLCDEVVLGHLVPSQCGVPVIGGLSAQAFLYHRFAGMDEEGILFGRPSAQWRPETLMPYLKLYAVDYAILSRADWLLFARGPRSPFVEVGACGEYHIFKVAHAASSLVYSGDAEAVADYDRIEVSRAAGTNVVLKLHHAKWLSADNGVRLRPERLLDDPVPFIRCDVPPGVDAFTIFKQKGLF